MDDYPAISDYALIGDCRSAALVSRSGSIDWCCLPHFDSPSIFAAILDAERGGRFRIAPTAAHTARRRYIPGTAVLETTFEAAEGTVMVTDFMPLPGGETNWPDYADIPQPRIVRLVNCLRGSVELAILFEPRPDYARQAPALEWADEGIVARCGDLELVLATDAPLSIEGGSARARLPLHAGDHVYFILAPGEPGDRAHHPRGLADTRRWLAQTVGGWVLWSDACHYDGPYRAAVLRSALTLKLLTYSPTGAVIAAPTTSLPEEIGGERNWDYRYTWMRDATFTLYALAILGYRGEARAFMAWLVRTWVDPTTPLQIMYGIDGRADLPEEELTHLRGYRGSRPVRIGNGAAHQLQLDIYGEVLDSAHLFQKYGGAIDADLWALLRRVADAAADRWHEPDEGIWEVRGGRQHFTYSKVMCWVALDRAIRAAEARGLAADLARWRQARHEIREAVLERGYNPQVGAFTQAFGSTALDASVLLLPLVGFIDAHDERMRSTIERIDEELTVDGLVYRYLSEDGLAGGEGTFAICTFWLIDCLIFLGRLDEAGRRFERMLAYANDLGLYAEEIDPASGLQLGNFPQAFTHIALINAAVNLDLATRGALTTPAARSAARAAQAGPPDAG